MRFLEFVAFELAGWVLYRLPGAALRWLFAADRRPFKEYLQEGEMWYNIIAVFGFVAMVGAVMGIAFWINNLYGMDNRIC